MDAYQISLKSLAEVCAESDIICIQLPSTKQTYHLINENIFNQMKRKPYLINI
jgi:lactate dehydrogenase-like 2-hydroxyacid dehydrogenase